MGRDITERKRAEDKLKASEEKYRLVVDNATVAIFIIQESRIKYANPRSVELFGYPPEVFAAKPFTEFVYPDDRKFLMERYIKRVSSEVVPGIYSFRIVTADGTIRWAEIHAVMITYEGKPATLNFIGDITERKRMEEAIREMSLKDQLTGLYNRRGFITLAEPQLKLSDRRKRMLLFFFADLDGMKWINDTLGHKAGDQALIDMASVLKETFRSSDIIGRMGGDEFAILAIDPEEIDPKIIINRLQNRIDKHNSLANRKYKLSISIGCSFYEPENLSSIDELMVQADKLMYEEKQKKKSRPV